MNINSGLKHFIHHKITTIINILLLIWFSVFVKSILIKDLNLVLRIIQKPYNMGLLFIFSISMIYHGYMIMVGMCEDYVKSKIQRLIYIWIMKIFSFVTVIFLLFSFIHIST